ncbi:hypothetical protein GCM10029964_088560 [Kibdelosporangium lantanae]
MVATVWVMEAMSGGAAVADEVLLRRVTGGDSAALTLLYSRHGDALFRYLVRLCVDRMRAEEVLQDTLLAVWRGADTYRGPAAVRSWLFGIARRQAYQHLRLRAMSPPAVAAALAAGLSRLLVGELDQGFRKHGHTAWSRFLVAKNWLALRGNLPWRVFAFLDDAHRRHLLRRTGSTHQFRHHRLQRR